MAKRKFTSSQISKISGASRREFIHVPFYYAPPFLDELRDWLGSKLASTGGRPTIEDFKVVRKVRFSQKNWEKLGIIARSWSREGNFVSPAQVATSILEKVISSYQLESRIRRHIPNSDDNLP